MTRPEFTILNNIGIITGVFVAAAGGVMTDAAHGLKEDDMVVLTTDGTLPVGLSLATVYYVKYLTTGTFMLKAGSGPVQAISTAVATDNDTWTMHDIGRVMQVANNRIVTLSLDGDNTPVMTIKILGSISDDCPNFSAAKSPTNRYEHISTQDMQNAYAVIKGDTGISFTDTAGTNNRMLSVDVKSLGLKWLCAIITSFTTGDITIKAKAISNN